MAAILQEANNTPAGTYHGLGLNSWYGSCFKPQKSFSLTLIKWKGFRNGGPSGSVTVRLFNADVNGWPVGAELGHVDFPISSMSAYPTASWYTVDFTSYGLILSKNNRYCFYIQCPNSQPYTYYNNGSYAYGGEIQTLNGGSTWSPTNAFSNATKEMFEVWGETRTTVTTGTVTAGATGASATATIEDAADTIDQYGYEWLEDTTGVEPQSGTYTGSYIINGAPSSPFTSILTSLKPGRAYWARAKMHLASYGWVYGVATVFSTTMDDAWTAYASYTAGASQQYFSTQYRAYSLFTGITQVMMGVRLKLYRDSGLTGGLIYAAIYATSASKPTGAALAVTTLPESLITTTSTGVWYDFGFSDGLQLQDGAVYAIVVYANNGTYSSPMGHWLYGTPGGSNRGRSQDSGATWILDAGLHDYYDYGIEGLDIETNEASDMHYNRATLWANILMVGPATEYGFDWSLSTGNFENELLGTDPIIEGPMCILLTGLTAYNSYKFRAKMRGAGGGAWTYGVTKTFMTTWPVPECVTEPPTATALTYIDALGCLETDSEIAVDSYGFVYGTKTVEEMLGRFNNDLEHDYGPEDAKEDGYDSNEQVTGPLTSPLLISAGAIGDNHVHVDDVTGILAAELIKLTDTDGEEQLTVDHVTGDAVYFTGTLTRAYSVAKGAALQGMKVIRLRNLEQGKRYYFRFWTHNSYGYGWGSEFAALTSDTVNLLIPTATAYKGIRFCVPGKVNFPPTGMYYDNRHHLLVRAPDSWYVSSAQGGGTFGSIYGKYVCERQYWWDVTNYDLYTMQNASKRTGTIIKVKWKARIGNNEFIGGNYHKRVISNGVTTLTGADYVSGSGNPGWTCEIFYNNPWTGNPWAVAETDDLQMGISIYSGTGFELPMCDAIEGRVIWANAAVTTKPALLGSDLSHVRFHGLVTEDECEECTVYFEYGPTAAYGSATTPQAAVKGQHIYEDLAYSPPAPGTYYHYRAVIETACGETFYGADMTYPNGLIIELAFAQSILTVAPTWTDVTTDCQALHIKRGRLHELDNVQAGVATFQFNNASGNYWRYNTAGAYYNAGAGVKPLTLIRCRYSYNSMRYCYYGVVENFEPKWLAPYGYTPLMLATCVDIFKSFAKYKIIDADELLTSNASAGDSHVHVASTFGYVEGQTVKLHDSGGYENLIIQQVVPAINTIIFTTTVVGNYTVANGAALKKWPSVLSGTRINDICLEVKWPLALTALDAGQVYVSEISPAAGGDNALNALQATKKAEDGNLFIAATGLLTFHDSLARTKTPLSTSQATFGDDGIQLGYTDVEMADDDEFIYNECAITGDDIGQQVMLDSAYQAEQGPRAIPDMNGSIIKNASDAIAQAFVKVERYKDSKPRCKALIIKPEGDPENLYPVALGNDLGAKITFQLNSTRNPALINQAYHIEGIEHDWKQATQDWVTKFQLWDINKYRVFKPTHDGYLLKVDDITNYMAAHDAADAGFAYNDLAIMEVGQWDTYAGAIWLSSRIERGKLRFNTASLATAAYPPVKAFLLLYLQGVSVDRAWSLTAVIADNLAQPLTLPDYGLLEPHEDSLGAIAVPNVAGQWLAIELNASGLAYLNYSGNTDIGLRSDKDIAADDPGTNAQEWATIAAMNSAFSPLLIVQVS